MCCYYATHSHVVVSTQHVASMQHLAWLSRLRNILVMRRNLNMTGGGGGRGVQGQDVPPLRVRTSHEQFFLFLIYTCKQSLMLVSFLPQRLTWCARSDREEAESRMKSPVTRSAAYLRQRLFNAFSVRQMSASAHRLHGCWRSRPPGRMTLHVTGVV